MPADLLPAFSREKNYQPEKWTQRHRLVVALSLAGRRNKEIAEILDFTESRVSIILNDPRAEREIQLQAESVADRISDVQLRMQLTANEALDEIIDEMRTCEEPKVRQKAAFGLLDRAGYTPVKKSIHLGAQIEEDVADRMEEALSEGDEIEASYEVVSPEEASE